MRVGIVTLQSAFNYGAFLQAYALQETIESMGHTVKFLNISNSESTRRRYRTLLTKRPRKLFFNFKRYKVFSEAQRLLHICAEPYSVKRPRYDLIVIGSDEVWNVKNSTFAVLPEFFGKGLNASRVITYAPSAGKTTYGDLVGNSDVSEGFRNITDFSVRDSNASEIVEKIANKTAKRVLDPAFLIDYDNKKDRGKENGYAIVYTYHFNNEKIQKTKSFARARGLKLVSPCFYNNWCDEVTMPTPFAFLKLLKNADYVVTDTFHGTIFSIIYRKRFGAFASEKIKVFSLLSSFGLSQRNLSEAPNIAGVMDRPIDYRRVQRGIDSARCNSISFLQRCLGAT